MTTPVMNAAQSGGHPSLPQTIGSGLSSFIGTIDRVFRSFRAMAEIFTEPDASEFDRGIADSCNQFCNVAKPVRQVARSWSEIKGSMNDITDICHDIGNRMAPAFEILQGAFDLFAPVAERIAELFERVGKSFTEDDDYKSIAAHQLRQRRHSLQQVQSAPPAVVPLPRPSAPAAEADIPRAAPVADQEVVPPAVRKPAVIEPSIAGAVVEPAAEPVLRPAAIVREDAEQPAEAPVVPAADAPAAAAAVDPFARPPVIAVD